MKKFLFLNVLSLLTFAAMTSAHAEETANNTETSTIKLKEAVGNKKFNDDTEITDGKLKAENGSLSKYSMKFSLGFNGPPTSNLDSSYQPNPDKNKKPAPVSLSGSISGKYRLSSDQTLGAGSGLRANDPMHGDPTYDLMDPFLAYSLFSKKSGMQMSHYIKVARVTNPLYTSVGEDGSISYDNWLVYDLGNSPFALEFDTGFGYYFYNRGPYLNKKSSNYKYEMRATRYSLSFIPIVKYRFNSKLNLETSVSFSYLNYRTTEDHTTLNQSMSTQRLGIGYSYSRDVYINPYISFYPDQFSPDTTSFNISTTFSIL